VASSDRPCRRIYDFLNLFHQTRFLLGFRFPSASGPSLPPCRWRDSLGTHSFQLPAPRDHYLLTDLQHFSHCPNPAPSKRDRFAAGPRPSGAFVQASLQPFLFLTYHALHFCPPQKRQLQNQLVSRKRICAGSVYLGSIRSIDSRGKAQRRLLNGQLMVPLAHRGGAG